MQEEIKAFYTNAFDIPSEFRTDVKINKADSEEMKRKKGEERSFLIKMRSHYSRALSKIGRVVNNSVWVIPTCNYERLKEINEKFEKEWLERESLVSGKREYSPSLRIIKFSADETGTLKTLAGEKLNNELNKFLDELGKVAQEIKVKQKIHGKTAKRILRTTQELEDITNAFDLKSEMEGTLKLIRLSVEEIKANSEV